MCFGVEYYLKDCYYRQLLGEFVCVLNGIPMSKKIFIIIFDAKGQKLAAINVCLEFEFSGALPPLSLVMCTLR